MGSMHAEDNIYCKNPKNADARKMAVNILKLE